jgi:methyl-accepting chemotaxis protein
MFKTIKSKLILFQIVCLLGLTLCVAIAYHFAVREVKDIVRADVAAEADTLEQSIAYISSVRPDAYKYADFEKLINSVSVGKEGISYLIDGQGLVVGRQRDGGKTLVGGPHIDRIRSSRQSGDFEYRAEKSGSEILVAYRYIKPWNAWLVTEVNTGKYIENLQSTFFLWNLTCGIGIVLVVIAVSFWFIRSISAPLNRVAVIAQNIADGDLDEKVPVESQDEIGSVAEAINRMTSVIVKTLREEVNKSNRLLESIREVIAHLSSGAEQMKTISTRQSVGAEEQAIAIQDVTTASEELAVTSRMIAGNAGIVEKMADEASSCCLAGTREVQNATEGMGRLKLQVQEIAECMVKLGGNSQKIGGVVEIIDEISDQTNLLALNAAIEAAGAGEAGKRFAIVAHEVRRLAERTVEATRQIRTLIEEIQKSTNSTVMVTEEGTKAVDAAAALVDKVRLSFSTIIRTVEETARAAKEISLASRQETSACEQMAVSMVGVRDVSQHVATSAHETEQSVNDLMELTVRLKELMEEEIQSKGKVAAFNGARALEKMLNDAVAAGRISADDLFDEQYQPIPDTTPQKYRTRFDAFCDETIITILDDFLAKDEQVYFAVLVDRNGYLPTHNTKYTRPLTGDRKHDTQWNRTKRLFNDAVGLASARNATEKVLVQVYFRDTGEKMWDLSSPVTVNGRHWGAFRIGYMI